MYNIIQKRKKWITLSGTLIVFSIISLIVWGLNFGIDFTGGSLLEIKFPEKEMSVDKIHESLKDLNLQSFTVQPTQDNTFILRFQETEEEKHQEILSKLGGAYVDNEDQQMATSTPSIVGAPIEELRYDAVGPSIGKELKEKSLIAIIFVLVAIVVYIAWTFRKVSKPVESWKYGATAIVALFHDVIILLGVFSVLGKFAGTEINTPFVAAVLTVLGYSVNDTIVVFDRIRENLPKSDDTFEETVNISVNQTLRRSIYTSVTTLLVLLSILFFGGGTIREFVLALCVGVFVGTYSSIFLASPVLIFWEKIKK